MVPKFVRWKHILVDGLSHHSALVFPGLAVNPATGRSTSAAASATPRSCSRGRVGPTGRVLGLDCCEAFLELRAAGRRGGGARERRLREADVQNYPFQPEFDLCFSRFGTMFFANPVVALRNMRREPEARRHHDDDRLARPRREPMAWPLPKAVVTPLPAAAGRGGADVRAGAFLDGRAGRGARAAPRRGLRGAGVRGDRRAARRRADPSRRRWLPARARAGGRDRPRGRRAARRRGATRSSRR